MADMDKVMKALEQCRYGSPSCDGCPYDINTSKCIFRLHDDALELLKDQHECENCATAIEDKKIVRCKDCIHNGHCGIQFQYADCNENWFCADGERK